MKSVGNTIVATFFAIAIVSGSLVSFYSCTNEPDESDLYTFTGQTILDFLKEDSLRSSFLYILERSRLDRNLSSYGQYTCFAPSNAGVVVYLDSLYNDSEAKIPHNGMTENSLKGLTDSLCREIAKFHLTYGLYSITKLGGEGLTVNTMLGRPFSTSVITDAGEHMGKTILNNTAIIVSEDNELTNGIVQLIDNVVPCSSRMVFDELARDSAFSIFTYALEKTGLKDSLVATNRGITYDMGSDATDTSGDPLYYPKECKLGFTIFAETNSVFKRYGITDFESLKAKCAEWYKNSKDWYQYPDEKGIEISTGDDYTNRFNVVNMFVAYHIIKASMAIDQIVYDYSKKSGNENWNYAFGGEPQDYFETMLPHTLLKVWQPLYHNTGEMTNLWINRCRANNTLTDQIGLQGSEEMHPLITPGVQIIRNAAASKNAYNGFIHRINDVLLYNKVVARQVLNERMRHDTSSFIYELINNGFRGANSTEISALNSGGIGHRVAFPIDYFENIKCYNSKTAMRFCIQGAWRALESDQFQGWDMYDLAFRMPPVPTGVYEIRIAYPPMYRGGLMQFYIGTSSSPASMQALGLPLDARLPIFESEAAIAMGWTVASDEIDYGVSTDVVLRNNGYMRGPCSYSRGTRNTITAPVTDVSLIAGNTNCRTETAYGCQVTRRIVTRMRLKQSENYWFRIKNLITDDKNLGWTLDYIELVPISIVDNQTYIEDWY